MAKSKPQKRPAKTPAPDAALHDVSSAVGSVGRMVAEVSNSLDNLSQLEQMADNLGHLNGLGSIAQAIAGYDSAEDRV